MVSVVEKPRPRVWGPEIKEPPSFPLLRQEIAGFKKFINEKGLILASTPDGQFPAYFGRDTAITIDLALEAMTASHVARQELERFVPVFRKNLLFFAENQGCGEYNLETEEEDGKIPHEIREGPENQIVLTGLKRAGWPVEGEEGNLRMRYYGSVDSTPLWLIAAHRYCEVTGDYSLADEIAPQIEKAIQYLLRHEGPEYIQVNRAMKENPEAGLVLFKGKTSKGGLTHQNWMDSAESNPPPPIYYTEVQGYYHRANLLMADLLRKRGPNSKLASQLEVKARIIKENFNKIFYWPEEGYFYSAIQKLDDGRLKPVKEVRSNIGHCLWSGIIDEEKIQYVLRRLKEKDPLSGERDLLSEYGLRTLSAKSPKYEGYSYHNGSIWLHDNALTVAGIRNLGYRHWYQKWGDIISCRTIDGILAQGSNPEFNMVDKNGKLLLKEDLAKVCNMDLEGDKFVAKNGANGKPKARRTPPNLNQAWTWVAKIYLLASTPYYIPLGNRDEISGQLPVAV